MNRIIRPRTANGGGLSALLPGLLIITSLASGCEKADLSLPTQTQVEESYEYGGRLSATVNGNVAEVAIVQADRQLQRGGTLWAKVGPYIFLFSEETEELFRTYPGLAGVRVITLTKDGVEVARALLARSALNDLTWRRSLNISGLARRDGTRRPTLLEDLVRWGEEHTEFSYNSRFVGS